MSEYINDNKETRVNDTAGVIENKCSSVTDRIAELIVDDLVTNRRIPVSELIDNPNAVSDYFEKVFGEIFNNE